MDLQLARNGEVYGICTVDQLPALVAAGNVLPTDHAYGEGWADWLPVGVVIENAFPNGAPVEPPPIPAEPSALATTKQKKTKEAKPNEEKKPWQQDPATEKQIAYLESFGVKAKPGLTKGEASELIDKCKDDPQAEARRRKFYDEKQQAEWEDSQKFPSYALRKEIVQWRKEFEEAEAEIAITKDREEKADLRETQKEAKEEIKRLEAERLDFWKAACGGDSEEFFEVAAELYDEYGQYFKKPSVANIRGVLEALDAASPDWDKKEMHAFFATYQASFPDSVKRAKLPAQKQARSNAPAKSGCLLFLAPALIYTITKLFV